MGSFIPKTNLENPTLILRLLTASSIDHLFQVSRYMTRLVRVEEDASVLGGNVDKHSPAGLQHNLVDPRIGLGRLQPRAFQLLFPQVVLDSAQFSKRVGFADVVFPA
jgi:hypothetical protein